jgi:hypothetical protein
MRKIRRRVHGLAFAVGLLAVLTVTVSHGADLKSPSLVKTSLQIFAGVYGDMQRKLAAKTYERLPHENEEFQDGAAAMRDAIANEPAAFKTQVESQLKKTLAASQHVADTSATRDDAQVHAALDALATSLKDLNGLFPESLRVEPGSVPPPRGPHGPGGPAGAAPK